MSFFGFLIYKYIDINDFEEVICVILMIDFFVLFDIIFYIFGGFVLVLF